MATTIQQWGNSLAVRLPKEVVQKRSLHKGTQVSVESEDGRIVITPLEEPQKAFDLASMVRKINRHNVHREHVWGTSRGNEVW